MRQTCVVAGVIQIGRIQSNLDSEKMAYIVSGPYFLSAPLICELGICALTQSWLLSSTPRKRTSLIPLLTTLQVPSFPYEPALLLIAGAVLVRVTGIIHFCAVLDGNAPAEEFGTVVVQHGVAD